MDVHVKAAILEGFLAVRDDRAHAEEVVRRAKAKLLSAEEALASMTERYDSLSSAIREHDITLPPEVRPDGVTWVGDGVGGLVGLASKDRRISVVDNAT